MKSPVIPDRNTRFARPIVHPKTGVHVSAEALYNDTCAALGRVVAEHIGDLILDNLSYGTPMGEVETKEMCDAIYAWADSVRAQIWDWDRIGRPFQSNTVARFWVYYGSTAVRIKLRKGQELACSEGGQTDEGYSYTGHCWSFDGEEVTYNSVTNARDCDGPISYGHTCYCRLADLQAISDEGCTHAFPAWKNRGKGWQRDAYAEAAGY